MILVPRPGIEPVPPAVEAWNLNQWTAREVPTVSGLKQWKSGPGLVPSGGLRTRLLRASLPASASCRHPQCEAAPGLSLPRSSLCVSPLLTRTPVVLDEGLASLQCDFISADYICSSLQISQIPRSWGVRTSAQEFWGDAVQLL